MFGGGLTDDDAARMAERGYISRRQNPLGVGTIDTLEIVWLDHGANERLLGVGNAVRERRRAEFDALKTAYVRSNVPEHLRKATAYGLQHMFLSDGYFIVCVLNRLVELGMLKPPAEEKRRSLGAVLATGKDFA